MLANTMAREGWKSSVLASANICLNSWMEAQWYDLDFMSKVSYFCAMNNGGGSQVEIKKTNGKKVIIDASTPTLLWRQYWLRPCYCGKLLKTLNAKKLTLMQS